MIDNPVIEIALSNKKKINNDFKKNLSEKSHQF